jgi:hypothetical protein
MVAARAAVRRVLHRLRRVGRGAIEAGGQGLDPVSVQHDMDLVQACPDADGASGHSGAELDLLPGDPHVPLWRHDAVQLDPPGLLWSMRLMLQLATAPG